MKYTSVAIVISTSNSKKSVSNKVEKVRSD